MKIGVQDLKPTGNFLNKRYTIEKDFPDDSSVEDAFKWLDEAVTATHMREYPIFYKEGKPIFYPIKPPVYEGEEEPVIQQKKPTGIDKWIDEINKCTTIPKPDGLESIRTIADMNPVIKEAFNKKLKELQDAS